MSDFVPSDNGFIRRFSRRLLNRKAQHPEPRLDMISRSFTPARPFDELNSPHHADRPSIHLQFTPMTPVRGTPRRLSLSPPRNKRSTGTSIFLGLVLFLGLSAVYKSGFVSWLATVPITDNLLALIRSASSVSLSPVDVIPSELYEAKVAEIDALAARLSIFEAKARALESQASEVISVKERIVQESGAALNSCMSDVVSLTNTHATKMNQCQETLTQVEIENIRVIEKLEADFESTFKKVISKKDEDADRLRSQIQQLEAERDLPASELQNVPPTPTASADKPAADSEDSLPFISEVDAIDQSLLLSSSVVFFLTACLAVLSVLSVYLYLDREALTAQPAVSPQVNVQKIVTSSGISGDVSVEEETGIPPEDGVCEEERIAMAVEDMKASIAREVQNQLELIEAHHEREMTTMLAIVHETKQANLELASVIRKALDETSIVSTENVSDGYTPEMEEEAAGRFASGDEATDGADMSSLSVLLETSVTPIRVPLSTKPAPGQQSLSVSVPPTCYSIASPSGRLRRRGSRVSDCTSSEEDWSPREKENDMHQIWANFGHDPQSNF